MSLTGSRFSTESAPGPLYGAFFVKEIWQGALFFFASFFVRSEGRFFVPIRTSLESARAGAVKVGRRANLARHTPPFPGHTLTASSTTAPLGAVRTMTIRGGARLRARINRATTLYSVGPRTRTMMQSCASAAKLRSGGPILPFGMKAKGPLGIPPPRTVSASRHKRTDKAETVGVSSASSVHCATRKTTPSGTMPSRTSRHRAISSLRAKATIMGFRVPRAFSVRDRYHFVKALFLWCRRNRHAN